MIGDNGEYGAIDVQVEMFTSKQDAEGFSFCLGIPLALFYGSERATGIGNNMIVLAENGAKANRTSIDDDGGLSVGVEI